MEVPTGSNQLHPQELIASLFGRYENRLYTFALKITRSEDLARDIVQEVFLKLCESGSLLDSVENIEGYLFQATRNKSLDFLRYLARNNEVREQYFATLKLDQDFIDKEVNSREFYRLLHEAIQKLPPQRGIIYQLSQVHGYSRKEIAEELKISESTVKNHLTSAISSLRELLRHNLNAIFSFF